jgi:hypothetical protein
VVVPSLSLLEVVKWVLREHGESQARQLSAVLEQVMGRVLRLLMLTSAYEAHDHLP